MTYLTHPRVSLLDIPRRRLHTVFVSALIYSHSHSQQDPQLGEEVDLVHRQSCGNPSHFIWALV